jgi:signal transduction histidine kinase
VYATVRRSAAWFLVALAGGLLAACSVLDHTIGILVVCLSAGLVYPTGHLIGARPLGERIAFMIYIAVVIGGGAIIGELDLVIAAGLVITDVMAVYALGLNPGRLAADKAREHAVREALTAAEVAQASAIERRIGVATVHVEKALRQLAQTVAHACDNVSETNLTSVGAAGQTMRTALAGASSEARDRETARVDARLATKHQLFARHLQRTNTLATLKSDMLVVTPVCVAVLIAIGVLVPGADLDPWTVAIIFYGNVACYPLYRRAYGDTKPRGPIVGMAIYNGVFTLAIAQFVARTSPAGALGYAPAFVGTIIGLAENYRVTTKHPMRLSPIVAGWVAALLFARGEDQLVTLVGAGIVGLACALLQGPHIEQTDARRDAEDELAETLSRNFDEMVAAGVAQRRRVLLDLLGRAHDAASPLLALNALVARWDAVPPPLRESHDGRARELLAALARQLAAVEHANPIAIANLDAVARDVAARYGCDVEGDAVAVAMSPDHLERVLSNLVTNAVAAQPTDPRTAIVWQTADHAVRVEIHDAGPGLPSESWPKPFSSMREEGVGLGALTSRLLVEAAGGSVSVSRSSRLGGARVVFEIPLA